MATEAAIVSVLIPAVGGQGGGVLSEWIVDAALMKAAADHAVFLHCLPAHRGEEVAAEVIDGPQSLVWQQAGNRMHAVRALFVDLVEAQ